jgi:hypothetical protein
MKTKCYSVRLQSLVRYTDKAYKATAFDGSTAILPKSQVFGTDYEVQKSEAYWISCWILEQKEGFQYSEKKIGWFNPDTHRIEPNITTIVEHHVPERIDPKEIQADANLTK